MLVHAPAVASCFGVGVLGGDGGVLGLSKGDLRALPAGGGGAKAAPQSKAAGGAFTLCARTGPVEGWGGAAEGAGGAGVLGSAPVSFSSGYVAIK